MPATPKVFVPEVTRSHRVHRRKCQLDENLRRRRRERVVVDMGESGEKATMLVTVRPAGKERVFLSISHDRVFGVQNVAVPHIFSENTFIRSTKSRPALESS